MPSPDGWTCPDVVRIGALRSDSGSSGLRVSSGPWPPAVESMMTSSQRVPSDPGTATGAVNGMTECPVPARLGWPLDSAGCQARMSPGWMPETPSTACHPAWGEVGRSLKNCSKLTGVGTNPAAMWRSEATEAQAVGSAFSVAYPVKPTQSR